MNEELPIAYGPNDALPGAPESGSKISFTSREEDKAYLAEPPQPVLTGKPPRVRARGAQNVQGVRFFSPVLPEKGLPVQLLGVGVAPTPEEASALIDGNYGSMQVKPRLLKGPCGTLITDAMNRCTNLVSDYFAYTTLIPWLLPKNRRFKPKAEEVAWASMLLHELITEIKPQAIVAFGKQAFDQLVDMKIAADDARGGWFSYKDTGIPVYLMDPITVLLSQPWTVDTLITDFQEVNRMVGIRYGQKGEVPPEIPIYIQEIRNMAQLQALVDNWRAGGFRRFSVDCEWSGTQYIDGRLRSIQFSWLETEAAYLNFFDENGDLHLGAVQCMDGVMDAPLDPGNRCVSHGDYYTDYEAVGRVLGSWLNQPDVRYLGHHFSADSPWMEHWLGLNVLGKCEFDLEFAKQTANEYSKLGLEVMALEYTTLGRYDMELVLWKKANPSAVKQDGGYGKIPDSIMIPYACLRGKSLVQLGDGSWEEIHKLVKRKYSGEVRSMLDGKIVNRKVTNWYRAAVGQKAWYRIQTASTPKSGGKRVGILCGPSFTPDHEVYTTRGKVRIDQLRPGEDRIFTSEPRFSRDQLSVLLGSLLGDGGFETRNAVGAAFVFSQRGPRLAYADWKADVLGSVLELRKCGPQFRSMNSRKLRELIEKFPRQPSHINRNRKLVVTSEVLDSLGNLGLAVWYQDDGTFTKLQQCRIACNKLTVEEIAVAESFFRKQFHPGVSYGFGQLMFTRAASKVFLAAIAPYMHPACAYKSDLPVGEKLAEVDTTSPGLYAERVVAVVPDRYVYRGGGVRWCLEVEEANNFVTKVGVVSNCKDVAVGRRGRTQVVPIGTTSLGARRGPPGLPCRGRHKPGTMAARSLRMPDQSSGFPGSSRAARRHSSKPECGHCLGILGLPAARHRDAAGFRMLSVPP